MARNRKKELPTTDTQTTETHHTEEHLPEGATDFNPAELERQHEHQQKAAEVHEVSEAIPEDNGHHASHHKPHVANPSSRPREPHNGHAAAVSRRQQKLPDKLEIPAGDMLVQLIDKSDNAAGIGIRVVFPDGAEGRPTAEEKAIIRRHVKGEEGESTGFNWNGQVGMWHKHIVREGEHPDDVPATRAVAIRLDAENRVEKLADALRQHAADPVGYADRVRQDREQASHSHGFPD
jgi:hypothetical protein